MTKTEQDIPQEDEVYVAGDTASVLITVRSGGERKDLSGADVRFSLARFAGEDPLVEKSLGSGIKIVDASRGVVRVTVRSSDTDGLGGRTGEDYHYEVRVRDADTNVATVTVGEWTIHSRTTAFS